MKLLKLTIHNIASIEDAVLDFENGLLAEDTRFLICGPLGSGKTTILDSICLALYNTTPRLKSAANEIYTDSYADFKTTRDDGGVSIGDPRMLMRRGAASAFVELVFTDRNDNVLTALWICSKARERSDGKIQDVKWTLSDSLGNGICSRKSETEREIVSRIGLTFEQFSRTTMLAQGDFTRFLKAKDSEKSDILEKLTGTGIYSLISMSIQKTTTERKEEMVRRNAEINGIVLLDGEEREAIEARIAGYGKKLEEMAEEEKRLRSEHERLDNMARLSNLISQCSAKMSGLSGEYLKLSSGLEFMNAYVVRQETALKETEAFIEKEKGNAQMYSKAEAVKLLLSQAVKAESGRARHIAEACRLESEISGLEKSLSSVQEKLRIQHQGNALIVLELDKARNLLSQMDLAGLVRQKEEAHARLSGLRELAAMHDAALKAESEHSRLSAKISDCIKHMEMLAARAKDLDGKEAETMEQYKMQEKIFEAKKTACEDILKEIRASLSEGEDCPLCGQKIARLTRDEEFESVLEPEKKKKDELWEAALLARQGADSCHAEIKEAGKTLEADKKHESLAAAEHENCLRKLKEHALYGAFPEASMVAEASAPAEDKVKALAGQIETAMEQQKKVNILQKQKDGSDDEIRKTTEEAEAISKQIADRKALAASSVQAAAELAGRFEENVAGADAILGRISDWKTLWKANHGEFMEKFEASARKYEEECANAEKTRNNILLTKSAYASAMSCKAEISALCPEWGNLAPLPPAKAEGLPERWNKLFADVQSLHDEHLKAAGELDKLRNETGIGDEKGLMEASSAIAAKASAIRAAYDECKAMQGADMEKLSNDETQRERLGKAVAEAEKARIGYEQWHKLYEIFGSSDGKKFRNIAQSYVLRQLLTGANEYLHQLTDRYELEAQPGSLTILLKDKEAGGVLRPTSTISGGESFLTSLSLALGLSSLGSRAASMDILFIDEGFGTLDGTYLETVMNALEHLHQMGGRKVGIISHVESLKERLATQVQVVRVSSTLSRIEIKNTL